MSAGRYASPQAVEAAIRDAARKAHASSPRRNVFLGRGWSVRSSGRPQLAASVPACRDHLEIRTAQELVRRLVDPAVAPSVTGAQWNPTRLSWAAAPGSLTD